MVDDRSNTQHVQLPVRRMTTTTGSTQWRSALDADNANTRDKSSSKVVIGSIIIGWSVLSNMKGKRIRNGSWGRDLGLEAEGSSSPAGFRGMECNGPQRDKKTRGLVHSRREERGLIDTAADRSVSRGFWYPQKRSDSEGLVCVSVGPSTT
ncbi:hypothetical protein R1sor_009892 [Riccia sorocarpa]|uniref:Uncharacterized protein n=1 Tax=Riccia sorocarpa TaxID=122646 RepID=A0ABD3I0H3_9MARC